MKTTKSKIRCGGMVVILVLALGLATKVVKADFVFGTPTNLGPIVNSSAGDDDTCISADGLTLYFAAAAGRGGVGDWDLWVTTRKTKTDAWGEPVNLGPTINSSAFDADPCITTDGLTLFFTSTRSGGVGSWDLWVTTRKTTEEPWGEPVNLGSTVNSSYDEADASISADGLSLYFCDYPDKHRPGGHGNCDIWVTTRATIEDGWGTPVNLGPLVNTVYLDYSPSISANSLSLVFSSNRPGGSGAYDLWVTTRPTREDDWEPPVNLGPNLNSAYRERNPSISAHGSTLYFGSNRPGGFGGHDIYQAAIIPIVDFNGDGIVDAADMCIMVDHWGEYYPLCDIGPTPLGDGVVDTQDLIVLAEHLFTYPGAVAYWKLDETEGDIAYDSTGVYDGVLNGVPIWQPTGGQVAGALAFDGIDDYVSTPFILDPADAVFSVFAWIKGGAPGQVVISQTGGGVNWLCADPAEGKLMTELKSSGRSGSPLWSQTVITDGNWHRIGFVWDGSDRILYVDDVEVARDTQGGLGSSEGGLYIGAGTNLDPGSLFSGLIDDVRIYNRAIMP